MESDKKKYKEDLKLKVDHTIYLKEISQTYLTADEEKSCEDRERRFSTTHLFKPTFD